MSAACAVIKRYSRGCLKVFTNGDVGDGDPVAEGDAGELGQVRPGLQRARARVCVAVPHPLQQRRQHRVLTPQPRPRP